MKTPEQIEDLEKISNSKVDPDAFSWGDNDWFFSGLNFILRNILIIVGSTAIMVGATMSWLTYTTPLYTAKAVLQISSIDGSMTLADVKGLALETQRRDYLNTQVKLLGSLNLAVRSIRELNLAGEEDLTLDVIEGYLSKVDVVAVPSTNLVEIKARHADPFQATLIANGHVEQYMEMVSQARVNANKDSQEYLQSRIKELELKIEGAEAETAKFANKNNIISSQAKGLETKLLELEKRLASVKISRIAAEKEWSEAKDGAGFSLKTTKDLNLNDSQYHKDKVEAELRALDTIVTELHPKRKELSAKLGVYNNSEKRRSDKTLKALEANYITQKKIEEEIELELERERLRMREEGLLIESLQSKKQELKSLQAIRQNLVKELQRSELLSHSPESNIRFIERAAIPVSPSSPRKVLSYLLSIILGPTIGLFLAWFKEFISDKILSEKEVIKIFNAPVLSSILQQDSKEVKSFNSDDTTSFLMGNESLANGAFESLATKLRYRNEYSSAKVVLVTSAVGGEGKSFVSFHLARALSAISKRVLLIDADMLSDPDHKHYRVADPLAGFSAVIRRQASLSGAIKKTHIPNLDLLPADRQDSDVFNEGRSEVLVTLLDELRKHYDMIVIDSPSVLLGSEALVLSKLSDFRLVVVKSNVSKSQNLVATKRQLVDIDSPVDATVLNGASGSNGLIKLQGIDVGVLC